MSTARFRFTPSVLDGHTLDALFVARHALLDAALSAVREAGTGEHRAHTLFVGPRGAGKTHLVALLHHRVLALRAEGLRAQCAWLVEDPWDIGSYDEFLEAVLESRPDAPPVGEGDREAQILASVASDGPIVVLAENFDRILTAIGPDGQRRLRALLENFRPLLLMATATRLSDEVARQDEPFYGFFDVVHLEPFGVEDAAAMLIALAKHEQNEGQLELLARPEAARRLATIAHLAGGQPRVWALLGPALQSSGIEDLVTNLLGRVDDLTPYYQEQLAHLSPQEARVVRRMAANDRPLTVRGIADLAKLDQRSVGKTISDLRRRGWIKQYRSAITELADKRHSYHILAEPLARLVFQVKESRGEPIQLVVEFIATWHDLDALDGVDGRIADYVSRARQMLTNDSIPVAKAIVDLSDSRLVEVLDESPSRATDLLSHVDNALTALRAGNAAPVLDLPSTLVKLIEDTVEQRGVQGAQLDMARLATLWRVDWRARLDQSNLDRRWTFALHVAQEARFGTATTLAALVESWTDLIKPGNDLVAWAATAALAQKLMRSARHYEVGRQMLGKALSDQTTDHLVEVAEADTRQMVAIMLSSPREQT